MSYSNKLRVLLLTLMVQSTATAPTTAQPTGPPCAFRQQMITELRTRYGEQPVAMELQDDGNLPEVLASPQGTWTVLVTTPNRRSCLRASGSAWEMGARAVPSERSIMLPE